VTGGLFDALSDAGGDVMSVTNSEAREAVRRFLVTEGIDIHPAAAVAAASLFKAVNEGVVRKTDLIMLNVTGGGEDRFKKEKELFFLKPSLVFSMNPDRDEVADRIASLF